MKFRLIMSAAVIACACASPAQAGEQILFAPPAEWVEPRTPKNAGPAPTDVPDMPIRTVLSDYQMLLEPDQQSMYTAAFLTFLNPQGLQAGNLSLPWSPETDELTVHKVVIHRGGKTIDVLADGQTFDVLRREQSLERATLDGVLTANMFPAGLEVGDTLELAYTVTTRHPVLAGHAETVLSLNALMDETHVKLIWPQGVPMKLAESRGLPAWKRTSKGGFEVAELSMKAVEPIIPPKGAPLRYGMSRLVEASDYASWSDVARLFVPLYQKASQIPAAGKLRDELEAIRKSTQDPGRRAELALALVQDKVRYVALAMGSSGLVPADAATTWARRYGDCKAKTALLLGLLHELGIEAEPVAVNALMGDMVVERLPAVGMFNHVLVRAEIGGKEYWLDGTRSNDATLAGLRIPPFGWALPVRESGSQLIALKPEPLTVPDEDFVIKIDASAGLFTPAPTEAELVLRGDSAIGTNTSLSGLGAAGRDKALVDYWRERFDFITPEKTGMVFDPKTSTLRLTMSGKAEMEWDDGYYETDGMRVGYKPDFDRDPGPDSDAPFANAHPFFERSVETIVLPKGFDADDIDGEPVNATVAGIEYKRDAKIEGNVFTATRTARSIAPEFTAAEAAKAEKTLESLAEMRLFIDLPSDLRPSDKDIDFALSREVDGVQELIDRGNMLLDANRMEEALADFDRVIALDGDNVWGWANRGITQVQMRKLDEGKVSLARALELDPENYVALRGNGMIAMAGRDYDKAIEFYNRSLAARPNESFTYVQRALAYFGDLKFEPALADADKAIELEPTYLYAYMLRPALLMNLNRKDDALKAIDETLARFPDDPTVKTMASDFYFSSGDDKKSETLLSSAISGDSPLALLSRAARRPVAETDQKLADLDRALEIAPDYVPALLLRAETLWAEYKFEAALADANKAIKLVPGAVPAYDTKSKILAEMGRRTQAAAVAEELVKANPDEPIAFMTAAQIYSRLNMPAKAREMTDRQAKSGSPLAAPALLDRAQTRPRNDLAGRAADLDAALKLDPDSSRGLLLLAGLQMDKREWSAAAESFSKASAIAPNSPDLINMRAIALAKAGQAEAAGALFDEARAKAHSAPLLNNICYAKAMADVALERALEECNASLKELPNSYATLDSRAMVYLQLGKLSEAIADFDQVLKENPKVPTSLFGRAVARALSGDLAGARQDAAAAKTLAPDLEETFRRSEIEIPPALAST